MNAAAADDDDEDVDDDDNDVVFSLQLTSRSCILGNYLFYDDLSFAVNGPVV